MQTPRLHYDEQLTRSSCHGARVLGSPTACGHVIVRRRCDGERTARIGRDDVIFVVVSLHRATTPRVDRSGTGYETYGKLNDSPANDIVVLVIMSAIVVAHKT